MPIFKNIYFHVSQNQWHPPLISFLFRHLHAFCQGVPIESEDATKEQLKAHILQKLSRHNHWGGKHTALIHVRTALPPKYRSVAEALAKELADEGLLTWLKKTGEIHVSLNSHRKKEIDSKIGQYRNTEIR